MSQPNKTKDLGATWKALTGSDGDKAGWKVISISQGEICLILAGKHFPGNEEAVLVGFDAF